MRDFESDLKKRRNAFDQEFSKTKQHAKIVAVIVLPFYLIGGLIILGLLAVALYGLARYVGLI